MLVRTGMVWFRMEVKRVGCVHASGSLFMGSKGMGVLICLAVCSRVGKRGDRETG